MRKVITVLLAITYLFGCGVIPPSDECVEPRGGTSARSPASL